MASDRDEVGRLLQEIGQRLLLAGENPYRARAYARAAQALNTLLVPLEDVIAQDRLTELPGVGASLAGVIRELHEHGTTASLEALRGAYPASLLELLHIPGLAPDKIRKLHERLGISDLDGLEAAARSGQLEAGLGRSLQAKVLSGIEQMRRTRGQSLIHHAAEELSRLETAVQQLHPELGRIVRAGEFRRGLELVGRLDLVAEAESGRTIEVIELPGTARLWLAPGELFGPALLLATGSDAHVEALRERAREMRLTLDERGLRRGRLLVPCPEEDDVYRALELPVIAPELRESGEEVRLAAAGRLPALVSPGDLKGLIHCHTDASDGANTLAEMAEATRARGYEYFGVADHSKSAGYAGGLSAERVEEQRKLVADLNRSYRGRFRVLHGIESDILPDGSLDYPDEVLARFDYVVASVHSRFNLPEEEQTERVIKAVRNPFTTVLGHMTGRLLRSREGYKLDIERVLAACAQSGVAVEINANPHRLDLDWRWHRRALELGCDFSINPDAHSIDELDLTAWGVTMARKGGVGPDRVLNALSLSDLRPRLASRKR